MASVLVTNIHRCYKELKRNELTLNCLSSLYTACANWTEWRSKLKLRSRMFELVRSLSFVNIVIVNSNNYYRFSAFVHACWVNLHFHPIRFSCFAGPMKPALFVCLSVTKVFILSAISFLRFFALSYFVLTLKEWRSLIFELVR